MDERTIVYARAEGTAVTDSDVDKRDEYAARSASVPGTAATGETQATVVGVVGLGAIGGAVARHLVSEGQSVVVCDVRSEALTPFIGKAETTQDPVHLASKCRIVLVAVVSDEQLREVMQGVLVGAEPHTIVVVLSTVRVETVIALAQAAARQGVSVLDCGVSGGPAAANRGQLVCMVGGDPGVVEWIGPIFEAWSSEIIYTGQVGSGLAAKLSRNIVQYGAWLAAYEGQMLAEAYGVDLQKLAQAIRASDALSGGITALMIRETVKPFGDEDNPTLVEAMEAGAGLAHKDLRIALELAATLGVDLPMTELTEARCGLIFGGRPSSGPKA
jgi:3-hydroxyisobutyrate dehydrogenase